MNSQNMGTSRPILVFRLWQSKSLIAIAIISTVISCDKQDNVVPESKIPEYHEHIIPRTPSYIDDRLYFADFDEFKEYFVYLDSLLLADKDQFDSIVLATSPVTVVNNSLATGSSFNTFLSDPVMRAIVNPYYEFQIDDVLVTYISNSQILSGLATNSSLRTAIRGITKGSSIGLTSIPSGAFWSKPSDLEDAIKIGCSCRIYIQPAPGSCTDVRVWGECNGFFGSEGGGTVTISFAGSPFPILEEEVEGNFEYFIDISAFDPGLMTATADPDCLLASNRTTTFFIDPADFASCEFNDRSTGWEIVTSGDGNERMRIQTSYYENFWGFHSKAEMFSQSLVNGNWVPSRADLTVSIESTRRSIGCTFIAFKDDDKSKNRRSLAVTATYLNPCAHCDGDVIGGFRKVQNNITLSDSQEVDFECCQ